MDTLPDQVKQFVEAATANAKKSWGADDIIAKNVMYAYQDGNRGNRWVVVDNYERFFSTIYIYDEEKDTWATETMYAGDGEKPYTFEKVMAGAAILFTG